MADLQHKGVAGLHDKDMAELDHTGHEAMHESMGRILLFAIVGSQTVLFAWRVLSLLLCLNSAP